MKTFIIPVIIITALVACNGSCQDKLDPMNADLLKSDSTFFKSLVTQYTESIDQADTALGAKLWSHKDPISFIYPRGHEHDWEGIKNIYAFFRNNFAERKLSFYNLKTTIYSDFALLEFYWTFDAAMKSDGRQIQTHGRETQVWRKTGDGWRLIHVHYSNMPATD